MPLLLVAAAGAVLGGAAVRAAGLIALLLPTTVGVLVLIALIRGLDGDLDDYEHQRILWWTMVAFAAHLAVALIVTYTPALTGYLGGDASTYHYLAVQLLHHWTGGVAAPKLPAGKEGFYYVLAGLYWALGAHMTAGLAINATAAAALVPIVTDTTRRAFGDASARYVAPLVVLLPGVFLWTSQLLKEAGVLLFIAVAANCAGRIVDRVSFGALMGLAGAVALLFTFRGWVALMVLGGLLLAVTLGRRQLTSGLGTGLTVAALVSVLVLGFGFGASGYKAAVGTNLEQANAVRQDLATSSSGYAADADISTPTRALSFLPSGLLALGFGPFPWQIGGLRQLPALVDVSAWWLLLPSLWRGMTAARRRLGRGWLVFVLPAATTSVLLALAIGNFGTVVRERMQIVVLMVPLIALGLAQRAASRQAGPDGTSEAVPEPTGLEPSGLGAA